MLDERACRRARQRIAARKGLAYARNSLAYSQPHETDNRGSAKSRERRLWCMDKKIGRRGWGEVDTAHPGYLGSQDTFYVVTLKGVGRVYQQSYIDTYAKVAQAKLYKIKTPITAADMLNDKVLPFHEQHALPVLRILTDRGTEYCGRADRHDYQLFLAINDIDHTKIKVKSP